MTVIDLDELTVAQIHQAYEDGDYTSEQLTAAYFARIDSLDQSTTLNAIVVKNPDALKRARELDEEYAKTGKLRPMHGIPVIVKDNYHTMGLQTAGGSIVLKGFEPKDDAWQVAKLKEAGAIVLVKSNMGEWAFSAKHTNSSLIGTTRNPYNTDHVPAGSSGGTAAGVAANFGAVGLGTDTGNSIRGPSSHNALVGFRSTLGLTSRHGIIPLYMRNDVGGPMCRTVEDATRILELIAGYDPADPLTKHSEGRVAESYMAHLKKDGLKGKRIGVLRQLSERDSHPSIQKLFNTAVEDLEKLGAEIVDPFDIPNFDEVRKDQWCSEFRVDIEEWLAANHPTLRTLEDIIAAGTPTPSAAEGLEYFLTNAGRGDDSAVPCGDAYSDPKRIAYRKAIEGEMDRLKVDAIIYPSWGHPPAKIELFEEGYLGDNSQIIAPHTGQPAFTVPMGFSEGNLPAGLQILGRMYDEPTLIEIAYGYEQGTMHRRKPY
ncbi:MAG: amidase [Calditrichia bacterium]